MQTENFNMVTVPLRDWQELQKRLESIDKSLLEIKGKNKPEFVNTKEVCQILKISRNTYEKLISKGMLTPISTGTGTYKKNLFKRVDLEFYLSTRQSNN